MADLKFSRRGLVGVYIHGVNVVPPGLVVGAAEAPAEAQGVNWLIAGGIVAIGAIGIVHSNRSSKRNPLPQPPGAPPGAACIPPILPPPGPGSPPAPAPC